MEKINKELIKYINEKIIPFYNKNDKGHGIDHAEYVIRRSLNFASQVEGINYDMVYAVAAYHDIAHHIDAKNHEAVSAQMVLEDKELERFFTKQQILTLAEAVVDHRSSLEYDPRSIYGKIVSSADRSTELESTLKRTYAYRRKNAPEMTLEEVIEDTITHIINKFGENGYAREKMFFEDLEYKQFLEDATKLASNRKLFIEKFMEVNGESIERDF